MTHDAPRATAARPPAQTTVAWIDAARVVAILAVISIHVVAPLFSSRALLPLNWWVGNVVDSAARWSVPLFVMISGALLLHADLADTPAAFYRRRLARILPVLIAWTAVYLFVGHQLSNSPSTLKGAVLLVLAGRPYYHLYFLYLIVGLYVVAPLLRPLVRLPDRRLLGTAVVVFMALAMADDLILVWGGSGGVNAATRFVPFIGYFLAGAWLVEIPPTRRRLLLSAAVAAAAIAATIIGTELLTETVTSGHSLYLYGYLSVTTVPASLGIFGLFLWSSDSWSRLAERLPRGSLSTVAALTLGVYVIHPLVLNRLGVLGLGGHAFFAPLAVPTTVLVTFTISLVLVLLIRKVPGVRRLV
ncbi:MAG: acyltransferase family protein [Chloroflexota bacterium]|nr:acyltransferase family protein [Chloroflexota bacterium]